MVIRTFFWHDSIIKRLDFWKMKIRKQNPYNYFTYGNSGDVFTREIINTHYSQFTEKIEVENLPSEGNRLLIVGSLGHRVLPGDILCGVGIKGIVIPSAKNNPCRIFGLRGPISYEHFKKAGYDLSEVKFIKDPGLLIRFHVDLNRHKKPRGAAFIPHYRDRATCKSRLPRGLKYIDIDNPAAKIAEQILSSEVVYSSSLHGIIFAHALNRPCVFVRPQTTEPLVKYLDYYESIDMPMPIPLSSIHEIDFARAPLSPAGLKYAKNDFMFPDLEFLKKNKICS